MIALLSMYHAKNIQFDWIQDENTCTIVIQASDAFTAEAERRVDRYIDPENYTPERFIEAWDSALFGEMDLDVRESGVSDAFHLKRHFVYVARYRCG